MALAVLGGSLVSPVFAGQRSHKRRARQWRRPISTDWNTSKDWEAAEIAGRSGPAIVPQVEPYLRSPDHEIRLLAVDCLAAAGGPQAAQLLIRTLSDGNEQVRGNAVNGLHRNLPVGQEAALLAAWDPSQTRDGDVRQQIPMILGGGA
ncbi:MAG: HEAT repeat domain-containing protein [Candidatus Rokuibacteriota bacterium]